MKYSILLFKQLTILFSLFFLFACSPKVLIAQKLIGTTSSGGITQGTVFEMNVATNNYNKLFDFGAGYGTQPFGGTIQASDGNLYGMTGFGGTGGGLIYKMDATGNNYQILHTFNSGLANDGLYPYSPLLEHSNGRLYGTVSQGGSNGGSGIIFCIDKDGSNYQILHFFGSSSADGRIPTGGLIEGSGGELLGMTPFSVTTSTDFGTIYKIDPDGSNYTILHTFQKTDGELPYGSLLLASDGLLYGMTRAGGTSHGQGVLFSIEENGNNFTLLHEFDTNTGYSPNGGLIDAGSELLGLTSTGGSFGYGTIFKWPIYAPGLQVLHEFDGTTGNGPQGSLFEASDGFFYGVCTYGGSSNGGTLYQVDIGGNFSVLHNFTLSTGNYPYFVQLQELSTTLPVTWASFDARVINQHIKLSWTTSSEINSRGFDIQKSTNGAIWQTIGFQASGNNGHLAQHYQYVDTDPGTGKLYYRLKQWDYDDQYELSEIKTVNIKDDPLLRVYPNPVTEDQLHIEFTLEQASSGSIKIVNSLGLEVLTLVLQFVKGKNIIDLDISSIPNGSYFLKINTGRGSRSSSFLINRTRG